MYFWSVHCAKDPGTRSLAASYQFVRQQPMGGYKMHDYDHHHDHDDDMMMIMTQLNLWYSILHVSGKSKMHKEDILLHVSAVLWQLSVLSKGCLMLRRNNWHGAFLSLGLALFTSCWGNDLYIMMTIVMVMTYEIYNVGVSVVGV